MNAHPYLLLALFAFAAVLASATPLVLARIWAVRFSPRKPGPVKNATYECGVESSGDAWIQFHPEYYLYAILFLVFDIEAVFLLPFAAAFSGLAVWQSFAMLVFVLLAAEGLAWAWARGALNWK
jgi:NADH-quinone oxidoreductase subunit A